MTEIKTNYPERSKKSDYLNTIKTTVGWLLFIAAFACPVINYLTGGKAWSVVVLWGLFIIYKGVIAPEVFEATPLRLIFNWSIYIMVMLVLIGIFLAPGWLGFILPIVGFSSLLISAAVLFLDNRKQKKQAAPFVAGVVLALISFVIILYSGYPLNWPIIVLGSLSVFLLIIYIAAFGKDLFYELRKRFHING